VEPLLAPRLEAAGRPPEGDPEPELSESEVLLALFDDVMVMVGAVCELEPEDEPLPDDGDGPDEELAPPPPPPKTVPDMEPRDEPRLPLKLPRLPRNCGAIIAANRSAVIVPVTRNVRWSSPAAIAAVRTVVPVGPPPSFGVIRSRFR
jgi:hypothetical protein